MKIIIIQKINKNYTSLQTQTKMSHFFLELNQRGIRNIHWMTVETMEEYLEYENCMQNQNSIHNVVDYDITLFLDFEKEEEERLQTKEKTRLGSCLFFDSLDLKEKEIFLLTEIEDQFRQIDGMVFSRVVKLCGIKNNELQKGIQLLLTQENTITLCVDCLDIKKQPTVCFGSLEEKQFGEILDVTLYLQESMKKETEDADVMTTLFTLFPQKVYATKKETTLESVLIEKLKSKGLTLSAAESCTGGLFMAQMINVSGASSVINRSFITYANEAKEECLNVSSKTLEQFGAVSKETAREMAIGAANAAKSDVAISITGIAGPLGGTKEKPVGTVYLGCYYKGDTQVILLSGNGTREEIRNQTVQMAKNLLFQVLNQEQ